MQPAPNGVAVHSVDVSQEATPVRPESTILRRLPVPLIFLIAFGLSFMFIYRAAGPIPLLTQWNRTDSSDLVSLFFFISWGAGEVGIFCLNASIPKSQHIDSWPVECRV
ncbi:hypothetical protein IEQ34_007731 [Dendrobium chrysotoxum]|uniref:Uncharacterized protein n=1 Tax=Dendrobium chrysotoxum TaxID=161865 RepID=A0AAV7H4Z1_DENCH|nr:hypothetical protein IEQ34_007731 [Dendrobium chrysotoxum]